MRRRARPLTLTKKSVDNKVKKELKNLNAIKKVLKKQEKKLIH
jgi:hypothetical protein